MGLHCSHYHGRGKWGTRHDPDNSEALCYGCHQYIGANPHEHEKRARERMGDELYQIIQKKACNTSLGRLAKKSQRELSKHYRNEYRAMLAKRANGETGRLEFVGYL